MYIIINKTFISGIELIINRRVMLRVKIFSSYRNAKLNTNHSVGVIYIIIYIYLVNQRLCSLYYVTVYDNIAHLSVDNIIILPPNQRELLGCIYRYNIYYIYIYIYHIERQHCRCDIITF